MDLGVEVDAAVDVGPDFASDGTGDAAWPDLLPACKPGEGCLGDKCDTGTDCAEGWCVEHLGESVCTKACVEDCPPGWTCKAIAGSDPDLVYVCVSQLANLCKPCAAAADCKSAGGVDDACLDYGDAGNFCGGMCATVGDCPQGFSCLDAVSVDGVPLKQCVNATGDCECSDKSTKRGLWTPCENENDWGTCKGKRFCLDAGLTECDAETPAEETCNGVDDDCDGDVDEPEQTGGDFVNLCDDGNGCTKDECMGEAGCTNTILDGTECGDGDPCTAADHCVQGVCTGSPVACDDGNVCTDDSCGEAGGCVFTNNQADCDDADPCTVGDECVDGGCKGISVACECQTDEECQVLGDNDLCNGTLVCDKSKWPYHCITDPATVVQCPPSEGKDAFCYKLACEGEVGICVAFPDHEGFACSDGNACSLGDTCKQSVCMGPDLANCNDGNPCTQDSCDPAVGCVNTPNSLPCEDGNACTTGDVCLDGACKSTDAADCDDGNLCTDDSCDPLTGCKHAHNALECNDGNLCTTGDQCIAGACAADGILVCDDANPCTDDSCNPAVGCVHDANSVACSDGDKCTVGDVCDAGQCKPGPALPCDDGNVCTNDSCDPLTGCKHAANALECDDLDACTTGDHCDGGKCVAASALDCDDANACTTDWCDVKQGCKHANNSEECDDSNACTQADVCKAGACTGGPAVTCDDGEACTTDSCVPESGCQYHPNQEPCDDGNACTSGDICDSGSCQAGGPVVCNDGNVCTDDTCEQATGCKSVANLLPCDDANACTGNDTCGNGACKGTPLVCDDGEICTKDSCDPVTGCKFTMVKPCCGNGELEPPELCDDGNHDNTDDCTSLCQNATCDDLFKNGSETDVDCGGSCSPCPDDSDCVLPDDCASGVCKDGKCKSPACDDKEKNGDETDLDCGGSCPACWDGADCLVWQDCESFVCTGGICQMPKCNDKVQNGDETDLDCGGPCNKCTDGKKCSKPFDCVSGVCINGSCQSPKCDDKVKNGLETGVDCGGGCPGCPEGTPCNVDTDCIADALCVASKCNIYGSCKDGNIAHSSGTLTVNSISSYVAGTVGSDNVAFNGSAAFQAGDRVILHQTMGKDAGTWEQRIVKSKMGGQIWFTSPLKHSYFNGGNDHAQILRLPEYNQVAISGGTVTAPGWNGTTGGILAFLACGPIQQSAGVITMSEKGYRGLGHGCPYKCANGYSGESSLGGGQGNAPAANGASGGGGTKGQDCAAGGGGGHGTAGAAGSNGSGGACAASPHVGGTGGAAIGAEDLRTSIFMGGAGGEGGGDEDGAYPGRGGNGGGIIIIMAAQTFMSAGAITTHGQVGANGVQSASCGGVGCGMSGGGGGAGGAIYLASKEAKIGNSLISAQGAGGGVCTCGNSSPGGTGGAGRIAIRSPKVTGTTTPAYKALP